MKHANLDIQKAQQTPRRIIKKKITQSCITIKGMKTQILRQPD